MGLPEKDYFTLEEIETRWGIPHRDMMYLAENAIVRLSARVYDIHLESGEYDDSESWRVSLILTDLSLFSGLVDLRPEDVYRLFRTGVVTVTYFAAPKGYYCRVVDHGEGVEIRIPDLVIRREERDRIEAKHGVGHAPQGMNGTAFRQRNDYAEVSLENRAFQLGPCQARVVRLLHEAARTDAPWRHGKKILGEAGSSCTRMADLFKAKKGWRDLILSDGRGRYRLNIPPS
jgi:hypothetical protein